MDGKYSKYIQNFMKGYKIKDGKIEIQSNINKKNQPLIYPATPAEIEKWDDRLGKQYQFIIDNEEEIENDLARTSNKFAAVFLGSLGVAIAAILLTPAATPVALALIIKAVPSLIAGFSFFGYLNATSKKIDHISLVHVAKDYLMNSQNIEETMQTDENITKYLSKGTRKMIAEKSKSQSADFLDADFLDTLLNKKINGRRDLINMLCTYKAIISLHSEPEYISPIKESDTKPKKKTKKKKSKTK